MKTIFKTSASFSAESAVVSPPLNVLPFGAGYRRYLAAAASMDEEEPAGTVTMLQPVRYLAAVEPIGDGFGTSKDDEKSAPTLRDAVIALRQKILAS